MCVVPNEQKAGANEVGQLFMGRKLKPDPTVTSNSSRLKNIQFCAADKNYNFMEE